MKTNDIKKDNIEKDDIDTTINKFNNRFNNGVIILNNITKDNIINNGIKYCKKVLCSIFYSDKVLSELINNSNNIEFRIVNNVIEHIELYINTNNYSDIKLILTPMDICIYQQKGHTNLELIVKFPTELLNSKID